MKIDNTKGPQAPSGVRGQSGAVSGARSTAFSDALKRKQSSTGRDEPAEKTKAKPRETAPPQNQQKRKGVEAEGRNAAAAAGIASGQQQVQPGPIQEVEAPHPAVDPTAIQSMVEEMMVGVNAAGKDEVQIQLNSKTFEGLRIHITKDGSEVSIKFLSRSDDVSKFLADNVPGLSQSLNAKGLTVGNIEFQKMPETSWSDERGRQGGGRQGGGQGEQEQQQGREPGS